MTTDEPKYLGGDYAEAELRELAKQAPRDTPEARELAKQAAHDEAERIMAHKRAIRDGGGTNRAAKRRAAAIVRPKRPRW